MHVTALIHPTWRRRNSQVAYPECLQEANEDNGELDEKANLVDLETSEKMPDICGLKTESKTEDDVDSNEDNRDAGVKSNPVDLGTSEKISEVCGLKTHSKTEDDLDSAEDGVNGDAEHHPESPPAESESIDTDSDTEEEESEEDNNKDIMPPFSEYSGGRRLRGGRPLTRCGAMTSESLQIMMTQMPQSVNRRKERNTRNRTPCKR